MLPEVNELADVMALREGRPVLLLDVGRDALAVIARGNHVDLLGASLDGRLEVTGTSRKDGRGDRPHGARAVSGRPAVE